MPAERARANDLEAEQRTVHTKLTVPAVDVEANQDQAAGAALAVGGGDARLGAADLACFAVPWQMHRCVDNIG